RLTLEGDHLVCERCRLVFKIKDGFPVLIAEEAELPPGLKSLEEVPCQKEHDRGKWISWERETQVLAGMARVAGEFARTLKPPTIDKSPVMKAKKEQSAPVQMTRSQGLFRNRSKATRDLKPSLAAVAQSIECWSGR